MLEQRGRFRRAMPERATWSAAGLAVLCGAALNLAFQPVGWWWTAPFAVAGLSALTAGRTARAGAFVGLGFGLGFCLVLYQWLRVLGPGAQEALGTLEALFFIPLGAGLARVSKARVVALWSACLWVGEEFLRARLPFGGMPWGRLAFSQSRSPFTPLAALGGAPMVSFAVALCGVLLWRAAVVVRRGRAAAVHGAVINGAAGRAGLRWAAVFALGAVATSAVGLAVPLRSPDSGRAVRLALIQGNVPRTGLDFEGQRSAVLDNHVQETLRFAQDVRDGKAQKPDAVIWPENSSDIDPYSDPVANAAISRAAAAVGVPILVGAVVEAPDRTNVLNQVIVWDPVTGPGAFYDKKHLVPFGEYLPFRQVLTKIITRFNRIPQDFVPGTKPGVLNIGGIDAATVICFEVAYDSAVRDAVNAGGQVILVPSNNASYGRTGQTEQQLAISQVRAVEHGRWVLEAATSGVSAVVSPDGKVLRRTAEFTADYLDSQVRLSSSKTVADRVGAWPEWLAALAGLAAALLAGRSGGVPRRKTRAEVDNLPTEESDENTLKTTERPAPLRLAVRGRVR